MTKSRPVLGRGLESLIPRSTPVAPVVPPMGRQDDGVSEEVIVQIELDRIDKNPYQPRSEFDPVALDELKRSIQEKGIIQPITVRRVERRFQLISGERRVRATREAGLTHIPAYIIRVASDEEMLELALVENLQREHLNPIEVAISYRRLIEECSLSHEQLSQRLTKDRSTITNYLRLLKLPDVIQAGLRKGDLTVGHARALISIEDPTVQTAIFEKVVKKGLSVREVERMVQNWGKLRARRAKTILPLGTVSALSSVEDRLRQTLGTKVVVRTLHDGRGEIVIEYYSADDLDRLLDLFATITV